MPITDSHCRELIDNVVDMAHFYYVHFSFPTSFRNVFEGTQATQFMESKGRPDKTGGYGDAELFLKSEATYYGPSYMINWLDVDYKGFETEVILINCHIPTGPDSFTLQYGITVKKPEGLDDATAQYIAKKYAEMFGEGFLQDVHIWKNKVPVQNPLLCEEDGPVYQLRRWYEQFYVDRADIVPEMVDRFEFEVDTTKANEFWQEEVAENLRKKAAEDAAAGRESPPADDVGDLMASFVPTSADTLEDQRLYTAARLVEVACLDCLARVGVKKNSEHHTSIQWTGEARAHCPELSRRPSGRESHPACPRLMASIEAAVRDGRVPIGAEDGY